MDILIELARVTSPLKTVRCRTPALLFFVATEHEHVLQGLSFAKTKVSEGSVLLLLPSMHSTVVSLLTLEFASRLRDIARNLHMFCRCGR